MTENAEIVRRIRMVAACAFALMAAVFVQAHSLLQANLLEHGYKMDMGHLPLPTGFFCRFHSFGYILPMIAFAAIFIRSKNEDRGRLLEEILFFGIVLASVCWMLACVLAWQLPAYIPVAFIR